MKIFFLVLGLTCFAQAQSAESTSEVHHLGLLSSVNLGIRYSSVLQNRGVILYSGYQIDPILAIFGFDDRLEFLGDSIGYRTWLVKDRWRLRGRVVSISDQALFPSSDSIRANFVHRPDSYELETSSELFLGNYNEDYFTEIDFRYAKDVSIHRGNYLEIQTKIKIFDFRLPKYNTKIEPNFFASLGYGDGAEHQYFYGPSASSAGLDNLIYGIWFAFPEQADRYYPIVAIRHFQVLGSNANAEYANGKNEGWLFSFIATFGVLE